MATTRTTAHGSIERIKGKPRYIRFGVGDEKGRPRRFPLPEGCSESMAEEKKRWLFDGIAKGKIAVDPLTEKKNAKPAPAGSAGETVATYVDRWAQERAGRLSRTDVDEGRMRTHVLPLIGAKPILEVTSADLRAVVEALDGKVAAEKIAWSTAGKVWGLVTKLFADACASKVATLRVRDDNPASGVRGPYRGEKKGKQWLFPSEATALLGCERVTLRWRRLYALSIYLYLRPGELGALTWSDIDMERGLVRVHRSVNLYTGEEKPTKTKHTRRVPVPLALRPLLEIMRQEADGKGRVIKSDHPNRKIKHGMPHVEELAASLREHLPLAGVTREDLFASRKTTKRITFYDLRATGITWEALSGTDPLRIKQRAGHDTFSTTEGYIREADAVGDEAGTPFPPLPPGLVSTVDVQPTIDTAQTSETTGAFQRPQRDSNALNEPVSAAFAEVNPVDHGADTGAKPATPAPSDAPSVHDQPVDTEADDGPLLRAIGVAAAAGDASTIATLSRILALRAEERRAVRLEDAGVPTLAARSRQGRP